MGSVKAILDSGDPAKLRSLFAFSVDEEDDLILLKFDLWGRYFFKNYYNSPDADFHREISLGNLHAYKGAIDQFVDVAFRGAGKDVKTKLFVAFCVANDVGHFRRFFRVLSEDFDNSRQSVTDVYNMLVNPRVAALYPEIFEKTAAKREEKMSAFTTSTRVKVAADTVGTGQRGAIQDEARPDFVWFNDFENRKTLRSARETISIWDNMEEARTGLEKGGACVYTCNYVSEQGNVHRLIKEKPSPRKRVLIVPIVRDGKPTWARYSKADIDAMRATDDDFEGERLCKPNAKKDVYFDRAALEAMRRREPIREVGGVFLFDRYEPGHRYGLGADVAGGVGLDSSTIVIMDFDTRPARVVAAYASNEIQPEAHGNLVADEADRFGGCIAAPESNKYDQCVLKAKQRGTQIFKMPAKARPSGSSFSGPAPIAYGWRTDGLSKPKMLGELRDAIEDGLVELSYGPLIDEAMAYTRNDMLDREEDVRLTTRHFDLLIAAAIAWQMRNVARAKRPDPARRDRSLPPPRKKPANPAA